MATSGRLCQRTVFNVTIIHVPTLTCLRTEQTSASILDGREFKTQWMQTWLQMQNGRCGRDADPKFRDLGVGRALSSMRLAASEAQSADYVWCNCQICADTSDSVNSKHASLLNIRLSVSIYHHHWYFSSVLVKCNTHHSGGVSRLGVQPLTKWCMEDYVRPMCNFAISHN